MRKLDELEIFNIYTGILQILNFEENMKQLSNEDLMEAMETQTKKILNNVEDKMDKILYQQELILSMLNKGKELNKGKSE